LPTPPLPETAMTKPFFCNVESPSSYRVKVNASVRINSFSHLDLEEERWVAVV